MRNSRRLYLAIINLSFSSWLEVGDGFMPGCGNLPSHKELAVRFPNAVITAKWPGGHSSRSRERTLEIWDPRFLCTPEHSIQIKTPKLMLAQSGSKVRRRKVLNKFLIFYGQNQPYRLLNIKHILTWSIAVDTFIISSDIIFYTFHLLNINWACVVSSFGFTTFISLKLKSIRYKAASMRGGILYRALFKTITNFIITYLQGVQNLLFDCRYPFISFFAGRCLKMPLLIIQTDNMKLKVITVGIWICRIRSQATTASATVIRGATIYIFMCVRRLKKAWRRAFYTIWFDSSMMSFLNIWRCLFLKDQFENKVKVSMKRYCTKLFKYFCAKGILFFWGYLPVHC